MSGYLTLADGSHRALRDGFVIGRVAGCDLVIDDGKASRKHAKLVVDNGVVEVEDLGSSNGTLLNDKPVTRRVLRDGDRLQIGKTVMVFREGAAPGSAVAAAPSPFADDDDLFASAGATGVASPAPEAPPPPPRPASPPAAPVEAPRAAPLPASAPPPPPAPPVAPRPAVVEFADEVVEVRKPTAPAAKPAGAAAPPPPANTPGRILQYSKQGGGGGLLGDDLGQLGGGLKVALVLGALALGAGIVWGCLQLF